jgi:hypothetical protein
MGNLTLAHSCTPLTGNGKSRPDARRAAPGPPVEDPEPDRDREPVEEPDYPGDPGPAEDPQEQPVEE